MRIASTSAPPGIWQASATSPPAVNTSPMSKLRPGLRGQIDRHEGTEAGLDVGEEEGEPVEAARARARHRIAGCGRGLLRGRRRHKLGAAAQAGRRQIPMLVADSPIPPAPQGNYGVGFDRLPRAIGHPSSPRRPTPASSLTRDVAVVLAV